MNFSSFRSRSPRRHELLLLRCNRLLYLYQHSTLLRDMTTTETRGKPTLLVTVGSTLFTDLTDTILHTATLDLLSESISVLRVQIGRGKIPDGLITTLSGSKAGAEAGAGDPRVHGEYKGMEVDVFPYTDDFEGLVKQTDLVVSHAGTPNFCAAQV